MSATEDIIEKIKKLLRLARSSNPHEAQQALARAMALAHEHSVEIEGLNPDESAKDKRLTHEDTAPGAPLTYDSRYAWAICRRFFNVDTVERACIRMVDGWPRRGVKQTIVGTRSDIVIAKYVAGFLVTHFAFCWRIFGGRFRNRKSYVHGMYVGIRAKLEEERPKQTTGLELVLKERQAYIVLHIGETKSTPMGQPDHADGGGVVGGVPARAGDGDSDAAARGGTAARTNEMKPPTRAPFFACMYHGLCDTARKHGYALTIHGTVTTDLDLVAIPWVENAAPIETVVDALRAHIGAVGYADLLRRDGLEENFVQQILARNESGSKEPEIKPHGRLAWNLYLYHGAKVDLSVMPVVASPKS